MGQARSYNNVLLHTEVLTVAEVCIHLYRVVQSIALIPYYCRGSEVIAGQLLLYISNLCI